MALEGWYYLHTNGSLIYKRETGTTAADIRESDFARALWPLNPRDREGAWRIVIEGRALGGSRDRIDKLAEQWGCDDRDAVYYAERVGVVLKMDESAHCATRRDFINLQESPAGFGDSYLEAMAELCKALGFRGGKMWGAGFSDLLK